MKRMEIIKIIEMIRAQHGGNQITVSEPNMEATTYIRQTSCTFKARIAVHKQTFNDQHKNGQTALSNYIHSRKDKVSWKLIDTGVYHLCVKESLRKLEMQCCQQIYLFPLPNFRRAMVIKGIRNTKMGGILIAKEAWQFDGR